MVNRSIFFIRNSRFYQKIPKIHGKISYPVYCFQCNSWTQLYEHKSNRQLTCGRRLGGCSTGLSEGYRFYGQKIFFSFSFLPKYVHLLDLASFQLLPTVYRRLVVDLAIAGIIRAFFLDSKSHSPLIYDPANQFQSR